MAIHEKLKEKGWYLSEEGIEFLVQHSNSKDVNILIKKALEIDLKKIGSGALLTDIFKANNDFINGNIVVQITKLRNMAAPKLNQESSKYPRLLRITLTDGKLTFSALEMKQIKGLSLNTPPGTKLFLKGDNIKVMHNYVLLNPENTEVLSGKVASLFEKWELEQNLTKYSKGRNASGISEMGRPPVWVPFGQNSSDMTTISEESTRKDVQKLMETIPNNSMPEFDAIRQENIERALNDAKNKPKKTFGGGKKKLIDINVQKIMDKGFSQSEAENALKYSKHNVEKALKKLQFNNKDQSTTNFKKFEKHKMDKKELEDCRKPSTAKISLSDFLEEKLPTKPNTEERSEKFYNYSQERNEAIHESTSAKFMNKRGNTNQNLNVKEYDKYETDKFKRNDQAIQSQNHAFKMSPDTKYANRGSNFSSKSVLNSKNGNFKKSSFGDPKSSNQIQEKQTENKFYDKYPPNYQDYSGKKVYNKTSYQETMSNDMQDILNKTANINLNTNQLNMRPSGPTYSNNIKPFRNNLKSFISKEELNTSGNNFKPNKAEGWKWNIGDRCLAKYWEDKKYYDAEITGISKNTCVVRFLEYGNFEEINKFDCLPYENKGYTQSKSIRQQKFNNTNINQRDTASTSDYPKKDRPIRNVQKLYIPPAQRN